VRMTIKRLQRGTPMFIPADLRLPNSSDLNSIDYRYGVMQDRLYQML